MYIYIYMRSPMRFEHSDEGIYGCHSHNVKLFKRIKHYSIR